VVVHFGIIHYFRHQVTARALAIAASDGDNNIEHILEKEGGNTTSLSLNDLPNMVDAILTPTRCFDPCFRKSMFFVKKPGIMAFQTWTFRDPSVTIFGVILGHESKPKKWVTTRIVCSTSWTDLIDSDKIRTVCNKDKIHMIGVIFKGRPHDAASRSLGMQICHALLGRTGSDSMLWLLASCLTLLY